MASWFSWFRPAARADRPLTPAVIDRPDDAPDGADDLPAPSVPTMIGNDAFCPKSGAPLSEEQHYDDAGTPRRAVVDDGRTTEAPVGELTNGSHRSSTAALAAYFRRCHRRREPADDALYREAAVELRRLDRAASGRQAWDVNVWFALKHRLERAGHDVAWMGACATPRCPRCHGRLRYDRVGDDVVARCGTRCGDDGRDRLPEIRDTVATLYAAAFDDRPTDDLLRFSTHDGRR